MTNRFKGLDVIVTVPEELWMEVCYIEQNAGIKTIIEKKKCKKAKWLSEEALWIAVKRRETKSKREKERYTHLNAEFQRIARRKESLPQWSVQRNRGNNRMGKTRDLFKKIRDTKGTFHAKMGSIKDRNGMELIEAEYIKKRWQEYTKLFKKDVHDPDEHDGVVTDLQPDILECEVKWALGSTTTNKASGCDGIPVELFQFLKDDAVKVLHLVCQQIWKTQQWPQDWKRSVFTLISKKGNPKECSNYPTQMHPPHTLAKQCSKFSKRGFNRMWTVNFHTIKLDLEKAGGSEIKLPTSVGSSKKQESSRKTSISALLAITKPLTVWITINCGKLFKRWVYHTTWPASWENCIWVKSNSYNWTWNNRLVSSQERSADFILLGSKITADGYRSHEIKRHLLLGRKIMTNLYSILKSRDITLPTKVHLVKLWFF